MLIKTEIKDFVRKVLLIGILLSFAINFAFTYFSGLSSGSSANAASKNELTFKRQDTSYLGDTGVALSLNIGLSDKLKKDTPVRLYEEVIPIASVLADKTTGSKKIIASNMIAAQEYMNILRTDVNKLLDGTSDRQAMLESFIDQLKYRGKATSAYIDALTSERADLNATITSSTSKITAYKATLSTAYQSMDYDLTQETLDKYLEEKQNQTYAQSYLVFLDKFVATYQALNAYNLKLLNTITTNKDALIKNVTVVLPDSGSDFMQKLELLRKQGDSTQGS